LTQKAWQDWIAAFPERPEIAADPYLYARKLVRACEVPLPPPNDLDVQTRIIVTSVLQNAVIDLLRIQHFSVPNTAPSAILMALVNFSALLYPVILPYSLIAQVLIALSLVGKEQRLRELKRATDVAQAKVDILLATLPGGFK
jgi:hypothetical protein